MSLPNLLVIDDDALLRRMFTRALGRDFITACAVDVEAALAMIDAGASFDVILCDLNLPGMSGHTLHDELKRRSDEIAARLVIITGAEPQANDAFATMLGARYLRKTCPVAELAATLRMVAVPCLSSSACSPHAE